MKTLVTTLLLPVMMASCTAPVTDTATATGIPPTTPANSIRLLEGDNPDPSIVRQGDTYYMVHSSFIYTPGLVVYKSANLVDWTPCSTAVTSAEGDIWAPDISVHDGRFYIYFPTRVNGQKTNMVTWADSPEGPWSKPVDLHVGGIDPEHVAGPDGSRYLLLSAGDLHPLSADGQRITGKPDIIYRGWELPEEWDIESFSLEGLNVKKIGDWYYMLAAEGGTAGPPTGHTIVQARAKDIKGPWENAPQNPLLRTESPDDLWWSQGHGSIVDTPDGRLFMLFHAYEKDFLTLGRQTLIREVEIGGDGWIHLKDGDISLPAPQRVDERGIGDFIWQTKQEPLDKRFHITPQAITIQAQGQTPADASPLLARSGDHRYEIEACVELTGDNPSGGLVVYYDSQWHFGLGFDRDHLIRYRRGSVSHLSPKISPVAADGKCRLWIRLRSYDNIISGWYSADGKQWHKYGWGYDMQGFHHNTLGGFLSVRPGIYAGGQGEARVTRFKYRTLK